MLYNTLTAGLAGVLAMTSVMTSSIAPKIKSVAKPVASISPHSKPADRTDRNKPLPPKKVIASTKALTTPLVFDTLHMLSGNTFMDGSTMIRGNDNNIYGTMGGGNNGDGVFYKLALSGTASSPTATFTVLHHFGSVSNDGQFCTTGRLGKDNSGNIYGTCAGGGSNSGGIVYRINTSTSAYTILHNFGSGSSDGVGPAGGVVVNPSFGLLYGTTQSGGGGSIVCGTIFSISLSGSSYSRIYDFTCNPPDGYTPWTSGLVWGSDGLLYGGNLDGGANNFGTFFKFNPSGNSYTKLVDPVPPGNFSEPIIEIPTSGLLEFWTSVPNNSELVRFRETSFGSGTFNMSTVYSFPTSGTNDGCYPAGGLVYTTTFAAPSTGMVYGVNAYGCGIHGTGSFYSIDYATGAHTDYPNSAGMLTGDFTANVPLGLVETSINGTPILVGTSTYGGPSGQGWFWYVRV